MNARRAANHSPTKKAYLTLYDDERMFRWSGSEGVLLVFDVADDDDIKLIGQATPDSADAILNLTGWKPADTDSHFVDWLWKVAYVAGRWLHLPGFRKKKAPKKDLETPLPQQD